MLLITPKKETTKLIMTIEVEKEGGGCGSGKGMLMMIRRRRKMMRMTTMIVSSSPLLSLPFLRPHSPPRLLLMFLLL